MDVAGSAPDGDFDEVFTEVRRRFRVPDDKGAIELAARVAEHATRPRVIARALSFQIGGVINLGHLEECPALLDKAFEVLDDTTEYSLLSGLHAVASFVAAQNSLERCLRHLVLGWRLLERVTDPDIDTVEAWCNLAMSFSFAGFHGEALELSERGYQLGQLIGLDAHEFALPDAAVRRAVAFDHVGNRQECVEELHQTLRIWAQRTPLNDLYLDSRAHCGYAAARLAAMGEDIEPMPELMNTREGGWEAADVRLMTEACIAVAEGRPADTLALLRDQTISPHSLGAAELPRVRALAYESMGDFHQANTMNRIAMRLAHAHDSLLRDRLVDGIRTRLDHETLHRTVERYASEALTDPLTGLPNRRHFNRMLNEEPHPRGMLGMIDLDNFKAVNTLHGHSGGDVVLQRVASILARDIRHGDFVARYGGDEFVLVLPNTDMTAARRLGRRLTDSIDAENWDALVAGTPVSITIGWAALTTERTVPETIAAADRAMLTRKRSSPAQTVPSPSSRT